MRAARADRLRVLVVAAREPWPLNSGGRLHLHNVLRQLASRAEVTLALPRAPEYRDRMPEGISIETISGRVDGYAASADGHDYSPVRWLASRHFGPRRTVAAWVAANARPERHDVVMLNGAVFGQFVAHCHVPVVWNPQDELVLHTLRDVRPGQWRRRPKTLRHALLYAAYERSVSRRAAATIYVSSVDAGYARRWSGRARIEIVRNGVDFDYFRPAEQAPSPGTVTFVGSLEFPPNIDGITFFARAVWPLILRRGGGRRLLVVGRRPVAAVRRLTEMEGVELHPNVPDVRPYVRAAGVVIVPTRKGGGLKNKILEACAMRRAVVASPRALGGLSARVGRDVLMAETPRKWAAQVCRLLDNPDQARQIAGAGYQWVRAQHGWSRTGDRFHEILAAAAGQPASRERAAPRGRVNTERCGAVSCVDRPAHREKRREVLVTQECGREVPCR